MKADMLAKKRNRSRTGPVQIRGTKAETRDKLDGRKPYFGHRRLYRISCLGSCSAELFFYFAAFIASDLLAASPAQHAPVGQALSSLPSVEAMIA